MLELATGRVSGYEALARFDAEPRRGPDEWFAQAHRVGLGAELEAAALRAALAVPGRPAGTFLAAQRQPARAGAAARARRAARGPLHDRGRADRARAVRRRGRARRRGSPQLRARGARIALDDAGAGYAGLQQLIAVAPDILKLDRSLVHGANADPAKLALLEAMISFAVLAPAPPSAARASRTSTTCARSPSSTPPTPRATRSRGPAPPGPCSRRAPPHTAADRLEMGVRVAGAAAPPAPGRTASPSWPTTSARSTTSPSSPAPAARSPTCSAPTTSR